ncbi:SEC61-beta subunit [Volvox carteri f. nagariensis]|uniref:SEC61-beta subunit n=1 Tax=Volvox carteri f. nagariensis TaxID=3068 RepID=D8U6G8_VOLCA|nr:SEC61-beta subunit [Volvox carteri f. nagariensis]EFJ44645.1 SEC61-beta subunit [Volvox carteri f. nagariensis]|eukprot:XP_002954221.1 SEC61-beta subunit [Volvox carteri f. nagariensis]
MPSQSQSSTLVARGGRSGVGAPSGATGNVLRRRPGRVGGSGGSSKAQQNTMNFYTDDSPGWKMSPVVVITMSLGFIAFVTILHVAGKFQRA